MAFSKGAAAIVEIAKGLFEDPDGESTNTIKYVAEFNDQRSDNSTFMQLTYTLKKPITEEELNKDFETFFSKVSTNLGAGGADRMASALLARQGFTKDDFSSKTEKGVIKVAFDEEIADEATKGVNVGVQPAKGRLVSQSTMRNLLETVMKENMLKEMTSGHAGTGRNSPLKNRTGRFVNSAQIDYLTVLNNKDDRQTLSLYYKYMIYPYQVFDPVHTLSPEMNLASRARNPQRIIHSALTKAANTLLGDRYKVTIRQVK